MEKGRKSETRPKPGLPINNSNEGTQDKNSILQRCKSTKCHNEHYKYKTKECLELYDKLHHSQQGREKIKELKKKTTEMYLEKENTDIGTEEENILA